MIERMLTTLLMLATPALAGSAQDPQAILGKARAALADARTTGCIEAKGSASFRGADVPFAITLDREGRYLARFLGDLPYTTAFDGHDTWERDMDSTQRATFLGERDQALLSNWAVTGHWASAASGLCFTLPVGMPEAEDDSIVLAFALEGSPVTGSVALDPETYLLRRITWVAGGDTIVQEQSGYGAFGDLALPASVRQTAEDDLPLTIELAEARPAECTATAFEQPLGGPSGVAFGADASAELEVRRAPTGHLLVHPEIAGADLGWFIFDTGAGANVISTPVAEEAGLEAFGEVMARGVGGSTAAHYYRTRDLVLGPVTLQEPTFVGIDLAFLDGYMGTRVGGVIGYELLLRTVAEFDITGGRVALHDPATYAREDVGWLELVLYQRHPCVTARFEGHEGVFNLDTGAAQSFVTFHVPAVERLELLGERTTSPAMMGGVGGAVPARSGTIEWVELGGQRMEAVPAIFAVESSGAFADAYLTGTLGGQLMAPYVLVFDYQHRRLGLVERE